MANLLWGNVYYGDQFAGVLREEPGKRFSFKYDESYLAQCLPAVSYTLPLQIEPHICELGLHPFFDNLVAEGWLADAQTRLLGKRIASRFELLLAFGWDCAGAVSVRDPDSAKLSELLSNEHSLEAAVLAGRASLSGVQPKLAIVEDRQGFRPARVGEVSTHIAKFASPNHYDIVFNEYLTTCAFQQLLPNDDVVEMQVGEVVGVDGVALIVKRFDRDSKRKRIHFEEFNQLLNLPSDQKYEGDHQAMADFLRKTEGCLDLDIYKLFRRILAGLLLGNTDMHLKNFALLYSDNGFKLTPAYDQVASALYGYNTIALAIAGAPNLRIGSLKPSNVNRLAESFLLRSGVVEMICAELREKKENALAAIADAEFGSKLLKKKIMSFIKKRWNGTFNSIGTR